MVFGTPGGDYQDQWSLTYFLRYVHHDGNIQQSIDRPMFHTDHMPSSFWPRSADLGSLTLEARVSPETLRDLKRRGHRVTLVDGQSQGRISAARKSRSGLLKAGANARLMQGYAVGR